MYKAYAMLIRSVNMYSQHVTKNFINYTVRFNAIYFIFSCLPPNNTVSRKAHFFFTTVYYEPNSIIYYTKSVKP